MNWESKEISGPRTSWTAPFPLQNMGQTRLKFGFQKVNGSKHCLSIPRQLHPPREPARQELVPWIVGLPRRSAPILGCNVVTDELEMSAIECPEGMPTAGGQSRAGRENNTPVDVRAHSREEPQFPHVNLGGTASVEGLTSARWLQRGQTTRNSSVKSQIV
jgi:hypothetical protein